MKYNICLALASLFTETTTAQSLPKPMSMQGDGYASLLLYLRRPEDGDRYTPFRSTAATTGHFYYPLTLGEGDNELTYPLQVSSYGTKTAVVGEECHLACDVPMKYWHGDNEYVGQQTQNFFKNFNVPGPEQGFIQQAFLGKYIENDTEFHYTDASGSDDNEITLKAFRNYVIFNPMRSTHLYASGQSGYLGLGPYTTDGAAEREDSIMYQLHEQGAITKNMVTYNITFNANAVAGSDSYVQLGDISSTLTSKLTWLQTSGWDYFRTPVALSYFRTTVGAKMVPVASYLNYAIFDPELDYLYLNQLEFDSAIQPALKQIYGSLICTANECHFPTTCDKVERMGAGLYFSISKDKMSPTEPVPHYYQVSVQLEDYLIDGRKQWKKDEDICYLPIFVTDPAQSIDAWAMWFLGNMFLDKYIVVHNMEGAADIGSKYPPRLGIVEKDVLASSSSSSLFLQ